MWFHDLIVGWYGESTYQGLRILGYLYPLWAPVILGFMFWELWVRYVQYLFFSTTPVVLLEIRFPKDLFKSPRAMELVINGLYQTGGESTVLDKYWKGRTRAWFSLEIASFGGDIHFYIWTRENMRNIVEAQVYAQYPDVEVRQVDDYALPVVYDPEKQDVWACTYDLERPDPLPIRTYIDYGLDKDPKEEYKIDPMATLVETLNSVRPNETIWLQFVIRSHKKEKRKGFFSKRMDWSDEVDKLRTRFFESVTTENRRTLSDEENRILDALHRAVQKHAFDTRIRAIYFTDKGAYNNTTVTAMRNLLRPFAAGYGADLKEIAKDEENKKQRHYAAFNSFKANGTDTDYPWQDYRNLRMNYQKREALDAYKRRMAFYTPHQQKTYVFTTEELATMFHFPGATVASPGVTRIQSKRAQAPSNLPV